jgi:hypothetical protein
VFHPSVLLADGVCALYFLSITSSVWTTHRDEPRVYTYPSRVAWYISIRVTSIDYFQDPVVTFTTVLFVNLTHVLLTVTNLFFFFRTSGLTSAARSVRL